MHLFAYWFYIFFFYRNCFRWKKRGLWTELSTFVWNSVMEVMLLNIYTQTFSIPLSYAKVTSIQTAHFYVFIETTDYYNNQLKTLLQNNIQCIKRETFFSPVYIISLTSILCEFNFRIELILTVFLIPIQSTKIFVCCLK